MKRYLQIILVGFFILSLCGCDGGGFFPQSREISDIVIIRIFAVDKLDNGNVRVTVSGKSDSASSSSGEEGKSSEQKQAFLLSCEDKTVSAATRGLQEYSDKALFWGHVDVCLIGEDAAKENIREYMDFVSRDSKFRLNANIFVTRGQAFDFLVEANTDQYYLPDYITNIAASMTTISQNFELRVLGLLTTLENSYVSSSVVPTLATGDQKDDQESLDQAQEDQQPQENPLESDGEGQSEQEDSDETQKDTQGQEKKLKQSNALTRPIVRIDAYAIINEWQLVGFIEKEQMRGYNFIANKIESPIVQLYEPSGKYAALEITGGSSKIVPKIENGDVTGATIDLKTYANIDEVKSPEFELIEGTIHFMEEGLIEEITAEIEAVIALAKHYRTDFLGISNAIMHKHPKLWDQIKDNYDELFQNLDITVQANANINRTYDIRDFKKDVD